MTVSLIAALLHHRAIGYCNRLLIQLPADMHHFRELTMGHTLIMGRRTFDSLPSGALLGRRNFVLSRSVKSIPGCSCFASLVDALHAAEPLGEVFVIGGASVYEQAMPYASRLLLTEIDAEAEAADAFFPNYHDWRLISCERFASDECYPAFSFAEYQR